jgi:hypothetical protein
MKKLTLISIICSLFLTGYTQNFKGTVYDRLTGKTLGFADIYINGTEVGMHADNNGNFDLNVSKYKTMPVTISFIGYNSVTVIPENKSLPNKIYLKPISNYIKEVTIKGKRKNRLDEKDYQDALNIFRDEFLGTTYNGSKCEIINEKDLYFDYNPEEKILKVYSSKPLLIHNKALGYNITYYLEKFEYHSNKIDKYESLISLKLLGRYLFKDESSTLNENQRNKIEKNREQTYMGSRMYFFRLLYLDDNLFNDKYFCYYRHIREPKIIDSFPDTINVKKTFSDSLDNFSYHLTAHNEYREIVSGKDGLTNMIIHTFDETHLDNSKILVINNPKDFVQKKDSISAFIRGKGDLKVIAKGKTGYQFTLTLNKDFVYFDKDGYFDPDGIDFSGQMTEQRIGDLLPFEYQLNENK